jgi:UDPglucose 6-dehydrogenase
MQITVVGTGNMGLCVGAGFAESGHQVTCVDTNAESADRLAAGQIPFYEPGLEELIQRSTSEDRLHFTGDLKSALEGCFLVFICLDQLPSVNGRFDVAPLLDVAKTVGETMDGYRIIINKTTCPAGTAEAIKETIAGVTTHNFDVVVNPQFAKDGASVEDFLRPDRVVVGCEDVRVTEIMRELYAPFLRTGKPFLTMSYRSAELARFAVESMLAARISLMNELANIAQAYEANISEVQTVLMADSRLGSSYLFPGIGFGGAYLPTDVAAIAQMARDKGLPHGVLEGVTSTNEHQQKSFARKIIDHYGKDLTGKHIAIWGASFKPRTDDLRNAPVHRVIESLLEGGATIAIYDPVAGPKLTEHYGNRIKVAERLYDPVQDAAGLVIVTEWREFHNPDFDRLAKAMANKVIFDGRNLFSPQTLAKHGFNYFSIGRVPA